MLLWDTEDKTGVHEAAHDQAEIIQHDILNMLEENVFEILNHVYPIVTKIFFQMNENNIYNYTYIIAYDSSQF